MLAGRRRCSGPRWVEPTPVVDVQPVRLGVQRDDLGAGPAVGLAGRPRTRRRARSRRRRAARRAGRGWPRAGARRSGRRRRAGRGPGRSPHRSAGRPASSSPSSIASSMASGSLCPPAAKSLMPLSGIGVVRGGDHHAEVGAERRRRGTRRPGWAARRPAPRRRRPTASPATTAASSISPLARGSRPTTATGRCDRSRSASTRAADADSPTASSGVRSSPLARPRTPSVPNRRRCAQRSALAVLGRLAGLLEAVLLALDDPRVAGEEAGLLQRRAVLGVGLDQRPGDGQAQRAGLAGRAAAAAGWRRCRSARSSPR